VVISVVAERLVAVIEMDDRSWAAARVAALPAKAAQDVLAGQEVAFDEPSVAHRRQTAWELGADRSGVGLVEDPLEVQAGHLGTGDRADDRDDVEVGVADLFVAVTLRPAIHPRRPPGRVQRVGDQIGAGRPGQLRRRAPAQPLDEIGGLGDRLLPRCCGCVMTAATPSHRRRQ